MLRSRALAAAVVQPPTAEDCRNVTSRTVCRRMFDLPPMSSHLRPLADRLRRAALCPTRGRHAWPCASAISEQSMWLHDHKSHLPRPFMASAERPFFLPSFKSARQNLTDHTESETLSICCSTTGNRCATWFASRKAAVTASGCSPDMRRAYSSSVRNISHGHPGHINSKEGVQ